MGRVEVDFSVAIMPEWFGGGLCAEIQDGIDKKLYEISRIAGRVVLDDSDPAQRVMKSMKNWYRMLPKEQKEQLEKDLSNRDPFTESLTRGANPKRRDNFKNVAKFICEECPIMDTCREYGLSPNAPREGVYGGLDERERWSHIQLKAS